MIPGDAHHGTSKDTHTRSDRAIVIAHHHPQVRRAKQIDDAAHPLGWLADWRVAGLRWSDVTTTDGLVKEEIRLLPDMTKGRHARTVFVSTKLKEELQTYAAQTTYVDRSYAFFASQKSIKTGFSANSLAQTFALIYEGAGLEGASSHSGRRTFLTNLANKGTAIHILKTLAGHRSISTTAAYLYSSPSQMRAAVNLI